MINEKVKKVLKHLLNRLNDYYSNEGCNDLTEEEEELCKELDIKADTDSDLIEYVEEGLGI